MHAIETVVRLPLPKAERAVRDALALQGFGVLTEIDVAAVFKAKLGLDRSPLKILGACNPEFAHRALEIDPSASLLLPCNVVLESTDEGTKVAIADPRELMNSVALHALSAEAASRLIEVAEALRRGDH